MSSFVRLNFSGSGVSLGLGPRGANINISKRGVRRTVGLPGTGLSNQSFASWNSQPSASSPPAPATTGGGHAFRNIAIVAAILIVGVWIFATPDKGNPRSGATASPPSPPPQAMAEPVRPTMPPPAPNRPLTVDEVREAQTLLKALGFDPGAADGIVGPMTIAAVKRYEPSRGWPESGEVDIRLLESLRASKAAPATAPVKAPPPAPAAAPASPPLTIVPNAEMRLAARVIREADHPCPAVAAAVSLSDGSIKAVCSNSETYRVFQLKGEWFALKCSAATRMGVQGC